MVTVTPVTQPLWYPSPMQAGASLVETMKTKGDECLKQRDMRDALWKYTHAIELSKRLNLTSKLAILYGKCAKACLKLKRYPDAYTHASNCIELDPDSGKVRYMHRSIFVSFSCQTKGTCKYKYI